MISVKHEQFQDVVPQEYVEFVVENDENFINIQEVYDEQPAPTRRRSRRFKKIKRHFDSSGSGGSGSGSRSPILSSRSSVSGAAALEEAAEAAARGGGITMATVLSSGGGGGGVGAAAVVAGEVVVHQQHQQTHQQSSPVTVAAAAAAVSPTTITVVTATPNGQSAAAAILQNGKIETVLDSDDEESDEGGGGGGSTIQVTVSAGAEGDSQGGGAGGGGAEGGGAGGGGGAAAALVDSTGAAHYITVTVPDTESVTGDGVAHSTYVQYVESAPDQTIYTTTNGQMAYPVYTVGESGTMYTPASGQYYTPGNTTPVTYSQVTAGALNGQNQAGQTQLLSSAYLIQQTVDGTDTIITSNRSSPQTVSAVQWLLENYETAEGVSLARVTLYNHYLRHCYENKLDPVNAASFGKLIRSVFLGLRTRRLGTRGNSKYHYYGIRVKPGSPLNQLPMLDDGGGGTPTMQMGGGGGGVRGAAATVNNNNTNGANKRYKFSAGGGVKGEGGGAGGNGGGGQHECVQSGGGGEQAGGGGHAGAASATQNSGQPNNHEFLGDGSRAIPDFPNIVISPISLPEDCTLEDVDTFRSIYREHCEAFLDAILSLEFATVESLWREFWRSQDNNNGEECEEEKYLSKTKLCLLCKCLPVQQFVRKVDYLFYQNLVQVLIPDVLRPIPSSLTQSIRNFAKGLESWLSSAMVECPQELVHIKVTAVGALAQTLRRYTSLNHLAQAARAVLQNSAQIGQMLTDLNRVDFHNVQEQAAWVCGCDAQLVQRLESNFKATLQQQNSLEEWAAWLKGVVAAVLKPYDNKPNFTKAARQFLLKWSFYSSMVIRDLTLRSAASFGSFHLIRLLYDEYMFYLIEHQVALATGETPIAVMGEKCDSVGGMSGGSGSVGSGVIEYQEAVASGGGGGGGGNVACNGEPTGGGGGGTALYVTCAGELHLAPAPPKRHKIS